MKLKHVLIGTVPLAHLPPGTSVQCKLEEAKQIRTHFQENIQVVLRRIRIKAVYEEDRNCWRCSFKLLMLKRTISNPMCAKVSNLLTNGLYTSSRFCRTRQQYTTLRYSLLNFIVLSSLCMAQGWRNRATLHTVKDKSRGTISFLQFPRYR